MLTLVLLSGCGGNDNDKRDKAVSVKTTVIQPGVASGAQYYSGTIEETTGTSLSFSGMGTLQSLYVEEGQMVNSGQLIGVIDATTASNALVSAQSAVQMAKDGLAQAQDAYDRMKQLYDNASLPEIQWIEVQTKLSQAKSSLRAAQAQEKIAEKGSKDTRLTAPFSGYISQKTADVGQNVGPGIPVVKLVKIDKVKVKITVPETDISKISKGQTLTVGVDALGGETFTATITEKGVEADPLSRSYDVRGLIDNSSHKLLPGMVCNVYKEVADATSTIFLPANIIQIDADNKRFVWCVKDGKAVKTYVTTGANAGENITITDGLTAGDEVITEGQQKVSSGMSCQVIK